MTFRKLYFILFILLTSCAVNQIQTPVVQINSVATYRPMCFLEYIERGDYGALNDSVSRANEQLILQELHDQSYVEISGELKTNSFRAAAAVESEIDELFYQLGKGIDVNSVTIPPTIDALMETQHLPFLLLVHQTGFYRKKGNYGKQILLSIGLSVFSGGNVSYFPAKAVSNMDIIILDSQSDKIVFRKNTILSDKDPNSDQTIRDHFYKSYKHF